MKINFTYNAQVKEGFDSRLPTATQDLASDSVDEIYGENVLEKVPDLVLFIDECYRILKKGAKAVFSSPHAFSSRAWISPLTKRCLSDGSLAFADKPWRELNKFSEANVLADFQVDGQYALAEEVLQRADPAKLFWLAKYNNVIQAILFTLTKR